MKQVTIKCFVYEKDWGYGAPKEFEVWPIDSMGNQYTALIGPAEFTYTIPDDFNPTAQKVAALEKQKERAHAEFAAKVREIDEQISKLQAIEYSPEVV